MAYVLELNRFNIYYMKVEKKIRIFFNINTIYMYKRKTTTVKKCVCVCNVYISYNYGDHTNLWSNSIYLYDDDGLWSANSTAQLVSQLMQRIKKCVLKHSRLLNGLIIASPKSRFCSHNFEFLANYTLSDAHQSSFTFPPKCSRIYESSDHTIIKLSAFVFRVHAHVHYS